MSELDLKLSAAVDPYPYCETIPVNIANANAAAAASNQLNLAEIPRRNNSLIISKIRLYVGTTGGNIDVGVWQFDGTTWTLLSSSGSTAVGSGSAIQTIDLLTPVETKGRRIFLGEARDGTTAQIGRHGGVAIAALMELDNRSVAKASSFPLATNATSFAVGDLTTPPTWTFWLRGIV